MDKLHKQIRAEEENVEIALGNLKQTIEREEKTVIELAWGQGCGFCGKKGGDCVRWVRLLANFLFLTPHRGE